MVRRFIGIGGGSLKEKTTLPIDAFIRSLSNKERPYALFFPSASHDSKPYFNTFRKTYCSNLGCQVDVALLTRNEMTVEHIDEKIALADIIYVGGGDTRYMLDIWHETGMDEKLIAAYKRGVILCGLSAGFIGWFRKCYTDYEISRGTGGEYIISDGLNLFDGTACPHYNLRREFDNHALNYEKSYAVEDNCAIYFENEKFIKSVSAGGKAYMLTTSDGKLIKTEL